MAMIASAEPAEVNYESSKFQMLIGNIKKPSAPGLMAFSIIQFEVGKRRRRLCQGGGVDEEGGMSVVIIHRKTNYYPVLHGR